MVEMQSMMEDEWECKEKKNEKKKREKRKEISTEKQFSVNQSDWDWTERCTRP